jgi:hypothetical protein
MRRAEKGGKIGEEKGGKIGEEKGGKRREEKGGKEEGGGDNERGGDFGIYRGERCGKRKGKRERAYQPVGSNSELITCEGLVSSPILGIAAATIGRINKK